MTPPTFTEARDEEANFTDTWGLIAAFNEGVVLVIQHYLSFTANPQSSVSLVSRHKTNNVT